MDFFNGLCGLLQHIAWTSDSGILRNEYCVLLDTTDIDLYQYEIWKKDGNNLTFVNNVHVSLDKFREYYFADERSTNYKIIEELIIPTIIKENSEKKYTITQVDKSTD